MLRNFFLRKLIPTVLFGILCLLWAQPSRALTISPLRQTIVLGPGQTQTVVIEVKNTEKNPVIMVGEPAAFTLDTQGKIGFNVTDEAVDWIQSSPKKLALGSGQSGKIFFVIKAPVTGLAESHYVVLFVKESAAAGQISVGQRVGSLLFIHPAGVTHEQAEINYWYPRQPWHHGGQIEWFLRVHNTSAIHVLPKIDVVMHTFWGTSVYTKTILAQGIILPEGSLEKTWVDTALPWWAVGPLQVDLSMTYGLSQQIEHLTRTIWYWPTSLVAAAGVLLTAIIIFYRIKKYRRRGL